LLVELTGAEAALVVNNCAAALMLSLNALARGRSVIVSRGELVEIGGSFRLPEICEAAGVRLAEVGTTNRTRLADYERRVEGLGRDGAGLLLKVHPSNFRLVGFTQEAGLAELVSLGRRTGVPVVMDQGSGALEDLAAFGVTGEPPVPALVEAGADLVLFSGDKLLGGPQAGCLVGRRVAIAACRQSPLYRVLRPGRLTLLALEATLWSHATGRVEEVPVQAMLRMPAGEVGRRAAAVRAAVVGRSGDAVRLAVVDGASTSGGGSSPGSEIPTRLLGVAGPDPDRLARALRTGRVPVVARIEDDAVMLDLRTVPPERDGDVVEALVAAVASVR
jgi:L-seryl-tRNA(Ser) seleniumtransferase